MPKPEYIKFTEEKRTQDILEVEEIEVTARVKNTSGEVSYIEAHEGEELDSSENITEKTVLEKNLVKKGEKEITLSPFDLLCDHMGFSRDWMDNQSENGVFVVDKDGNELKSAEEIEEKVKDGEVYIFNLAEGVGPFGLKKDDQLNYLVTEAAIEVEDIAELPEKTSYYNILYSEIDGGIPTIEQIESGDTLNAGQLAVDEKRKVAKVKLTKAEADSLSFIDDPAALDQYNATFRGQQASFEGPAPEVPPENLMPEKPRPLTWGQKFWNSIVSIFNKKGSAAKQSYDSRMQIRTQAEAEYSEWRETFNKTQESYHKVKANIDAVKELQAQAKAKVADAIKENPDGPDLQTLSREKIDDTIAMRKALFKDPLAGITHTFQNGINIENIACYEQFLAKRLGEKPLNKSNQELFAEYMIVHDLNKKLTRDLEKSQDGSLHGHNTHESGDIRDLRDSENKISLLNNPDKKRELVSQFQKSRTFSHMQEVFKDGIVLEKIDHEQKVISSIEEFETVMSPLYEYRKSIIDNLGSKPVGPETVQTLVKLCMLDETITSTERMVKHPHFGISDKIKYVQTLLIELSPDVYAQRKLRDEMKAANPDLERRKHEAVTNSLKEKEPNQAKYNEATSFLENYDEVFNKHPGIIEVCKQFEGQTFPGEALFSAVKGIDARLLNQAKVKEQSPQANQ